MIRWWSIFVLLLAFSAAAGEVSEAASSYWTALEAAGYIPDGKNADRERFQEYIARLDEFAGILHDGLTIEPEVLRLLTDVHKRLMSMDVGHLYDVMPHADTGTPWRAVGLQGGQEKDHYVMRVADPCIAAWNEARSGGTEPAWGSRRRFGDLNLRAFVQPAGKQRLLLSTEAELSPGAFPGGNAVRALTAFIAAAETHARAAAERNLSDEEIGRAVIASLVRDFPSAVGFMQQVVLADAIVATCDPDGSVVFDATWVANDRGMKKRYPNLARMVRRMNKILHASATVTDEDGVVYLVTRFNEAGALAGLQFRSRDGVLLPLSSMAPAAAKPFDLLGRDRRALHLVADVGLNIMGARFEIRGLTNRLDYAFFDVGPHLEFQVNKTPAEISASGRVMGILPLWFVDLLIPSNLDRMTAGFFQTLVQGRDGRGFEMTVGARPDTGRTLWVLLDSEVMSNGTMKFALGLSQRFTGGRFKVVREVNQLAYDVWQAFMLDYHRRYPGS